MLSASRRPYWFATATCRHMGYKIRDYTGIMEGKMETTMLGYVGYDLGFHLLAIPHPHPLNEQTQNKQGPAAYLPQPTTLSS